VARGAGAVLAGDLDAAALKRSPDRFTRAFDGRLDGIAGRHPADPVLLILPSLDAHLHIALPGEGLKEIENEYPGSLGHVYKLRAEQDVTHIDQGSAPAARVTQESPIGTTSRRLTAEAG
jgi:hypothetical protein